MSKPEGGGRLPQAHDLGYLGYALPKGAEPVSKDEAMKLREWLGCAYSLHRAPTQDYPDLEMILPDATRFDFRLLPGDMELRDQEDGFEDATLVDGFLEASPGTFIFWNSLLLDDITPIFKCAYTAEAREWMMNARLKTTLGVTNLDAGLSLVSDLFIKYSILSGPPGTLVTFDRSWGGRYKLRHDFVSYIQGLPREEDRKWAIAILLPLAEPSP
jgi:hypothetical protein